MNKPFKILSIDGGGIRGVYPAHILQNIEERLHIDLYDSFDMIAGTSTGAIIAAGIATKIPAAYIVKMYKEHGSKIFKKKFFCLPGKKWRNIIQPMYTSVYNSYYLENILTDIYNKKYLGEITKPLLIPSTDIGNGCVHVLKSGYSKEFFRDRNVLLKDAVLASCSAPTYFNPHKIDNYLLTDGGLWANNPAFVAITDAKKRLDVAQNDIRILTLGTGHSKTMYGTETSKKWGLLNGWKNKEFISFILSLQSQSAMNYLKLHLKPEQILRIDFESDYPLPLDDVTKINDFLSRADHDFTRQSGKISHFINKE